MSGSFLIQVAVFLAAAAIAAPIAKKLNISSVIGYLAAGMLIGPYGLGFVYAVYQVEGILHIAEYGVALLLFLIGLELKPKRLWTMRGAIFGLGAGQVAIAAACLGPLVALQFGVSWEQAAFIALALSLSSTAFVLQVLQEKGELHKVHGRAAFSVLLFQDLAAIPLIAIVPLFAVGDTGVSISAEAVVKAVGAIVLVVVFGRYVLSTLYQLVASTGVREAMTASALLTVVGVALLMESAGLSAALGAFLAGALLADSAYRHQIEADIAPFKGLLLGLFFTTVGMSLDLHLLTEVPGFIAISVAGLMIVKVVTLFLLGRVRGLNTKASRRLALSLAQGGEFAFVLFAAAATSRVLNSELVELLNVIVTLSMLATPLLLLVDEFLFARSEKVEEPKYDELPEEHGHVIIAGLGRFGQIVARILRARGIPFTALEQSTERVNLAARFGNKAYFGDASRLDILEAAQVGRARAFVLTISDIEVSVRTAEILRQHFPHVPVFARARNRNHLHRLMDQGVKVILRETFLSSLDLAHGVLRELGYSEADVNHTIDTFREHDERRLVEDYAHYTDVEKLQARARSQSAELEELFKQDAEDLGDGITPGPDKSSQ